MAHILFVDDEPAIRETLPDILAMRGHTVVSAATVAEALGFITSQRFDLLISDLNIGHPADGFIVVSAMRRTDPKCVTFIMTGYPGFETALQAIREQVDAYLIKPTDIKQLLATIDEKLSTREPREIRANKRLSMILRENISPIVELTLAAMKQDPDLGALPLTDGQRIEGLADALGELANVLDAGGPSMLEKAAHSGQSRQQQKHHLGMMVQNKRIIEQVISKVFYANLLSLDLSHLVMDMARLNDTLLWQLATSIHVYLETHPPPSAVESVEEPNVEPKPIHGSAEQFAAIIESAMDAIISVDAHQRVVLFNRAAEQLFGYSAAEAMGRPLDQFLPEEFRDAHRQHIARFGATGVTSRSMRSPATLSAVRSNGEQFPIEATISQVGDGDQKRYTVILRDITYRMRTERALIHSEKLASLGRLSSAVAHEVNNPLEGLKNLLYVITSNPSDTEKVRKYAEMADTEVHRIADITRQVLGLSRGGDMHGPFRPTEVLDSVLVLVQRKFGEKDAVLKKEYRHDAEVWGMAAEIRQVFWNLLVNGLDAIHNGGLIRVRVSRWHHPRDERKGVRVTFADDGTGISRPHLPRLFEPFFTSKSNGNGLGLWVAKQIVDNHSGSIRVRSRAGGSRTGTVFSVFLPEHAGAKPTAVAPDGIGVAPLGNSRTGAA
jgi:PAS domain S-box-containing protein